MSEILKGTEKDFKELFDTLYNSGRIDDAMRLAAMYKKILDFEAAGQKAPAENEHLLKQLKGEFVELVKDSSQSVQASTMNAYHKLESNVMDSCHKIAEGTASLKQRFFNTCRHTLAYMKQSVHHFKANTMSFFLVKDTMEDLQKHYANVNENYREAITKWETRSERTHGFTGNIRNAFAALRGQEAQAFDTAPGKISQHYIDRLNEKIKTNEERIVSLGETIEKVDKFYIADSFGDLAICHNINIKVEDIDGKPTAVVYGSQLQSVYNAIESDPRTVYGMFKNELDPDGTILDRYKQGLVHAEGHGFDVDDAYAMVAYKYLSFCDPRNGVVEPLRAPTEEQLVLAMNAAAFYGERDIKPIAEVMEKDSVGEPEKKKMGIADLSNNAEKAAANTQERKPQERMETER